MAKKVLVLLIGEVLEDPRVRRTCLSLAESGADVTVACTNPSRRPQRESFGGVSIVRFPHRKEFFLKRLYLWLRGKAPPSLDRILERGHEGIPTSHLGARLRNAVLNLNFRHFMNSNTAINRKMVEAFSGGSFDLVHCNDVDTLFAGSELKRRGAAKAMLYDSHEYWPGIGVHGSKPNESLSEIEGTYIREADFVVTVNRAIAELLRERYGLPVTPSVVMNCPDRYDGEVQTDRVHDPVRVIYQGKIQAFRGLVELVTAFRDIEGAVLTISGYGPLEESLKLLVRSQGLSDRVAFTGRYLPEEAVPLLAEHDVGVMTFRDVTLNIRYSSPNKLFDYAMAGLAVAACDLPAIRAAITEHEMGTIIEDATPSGIAGTLRSVLADRPRLMRWKENARRAALDVFTWPKQFAHYPWKP